MPFQFACPGALFISSVFVCFCWYNWRVCECGRSNIPVKVLRKGGTMLT
jgi:hypothetical protein